MESKLNEAKLTLWFRIILLVAFVTMIIAIGTQEAKYNSLQNEYTSYRIEAQKQIGELEGEVDDMSTRMRKSMFIQREAECLAKNIYFEASNESYDGKMAVATVTKNRVNASGYPKTYCGVVYQGCQFSWTCNTNNKAITANAEYRSAQKIAEEVLLMGKKSNIIDRTVMFYHAKYVKPSWAATRQAVTQIGSHIFYR